jgi:hypothetical protein
MKEEFVKSDKIKIEILKALEISEKPLTYYQMAKETKTTWNSLVPNCNFLNKIGFIKITEGSTPGMTFKSIEITKKGISALKDLI